MVNKDYATLGAGIQQNFDETFSPTTLTARQYAEAEASKSNKTLAQLAAQMGVSEQNIIDSFGGTGLATQQANEKSTAYKDIYNQINALTTYANAGEYAPQEIKNTATSVYNSYAPDQLESFLNPSNVTQPISVWKPGDAPGATTTPDPNARLMKFADVSMLNNNLSALASTSNLPNTSVTMPVNNSQLYAPNSINMTSGVAPDLTTASVIDSLDSIKESAAIEALTTAKNQALNALDQEQSTIEPQYADARSQTRALSSRSGQSFQQLLANKGINISGQSALGETMRTGALQGEIGALNQDELAALGDIESRRTDVNIGYEGDVAQSRAQALEAQIAQDKLDAENQAAQERSDYLSTIGRFSNNYQEEINNVTNDGDPTNDWQLQFLEAARQDKINQLGLDQSGNPITETAGMVSQEAQDALNAYNSGFRTQAVIDILTNAGYQFPTIGTSGGVSTTTTPTTGYTTDQYNQYRVSRDSILRAYANDPQGMIDHVLGKASTLTNVLGTDLYNQLVADVRATVTAEPVVESVVEDRSISQLSTEIGMALGAAMVDLSEPLNQYQMLGIMDTPNTGDEIFSYKGKSYSLNRLDEYLSNLIAQGNMTEREANSIFASLGI